MILMLVDISPKSQNYCSEWEEKWFILWNLRNLTSGSNLCLHLSFSNDI
jgi:hypothetical protein